MSEISTEVGKRIRTFRKMRHMTLEELAAAVCKSKSTVSKYEKGEIAVDIETLYELAAALHVRAEQLLLFRPEPDEGASGGSCPAFSRALPGFTPIFTTAGQAAFSAAPSTSWPGQTAGARMSSCT